MKHVVLTATAGLALIACSSSGPNNDPDIQYPEDGKVTMRAGNREYVLVSKDDHGALFEPDYLPKWAARYPGSTLRNKSATYEQGKLVDLGIGYETSDDVEEVIRFYEKTIQQVGVRVNAKRRGINGTFIDLSGNPSPRSAINIIKQNNADGSTATTIVFIGVVAE
jgi:hypothetical protein